MYLIEFLKIQLLFPYTDYWFFFFFFISNLTYCRFLKKLKTKIFDLKVPTISVAIVGREIYVSIPVGLSKTFLTPTVVTVNSRIYIGNSTKLMFTVLSLD